MYRKKSIIIAITALTLSLFTGCGDSDTAKSNHSSDTPVVSNVSVPKSGDLPILSIEQVEISYSELDHENGTTVPVKFSVSGIKNGWANMGIHIAFDNRLEVQLDPSGAPAFEKGDAVQYIDAMMSALWSGEAPEKLKDKEMDNLFICSTSSENTGLNGMISEFQFVIPADTEVGDVYNLEFFYNETLDENGNVIVRDCFTTVEQDKEIENYAFANWQNGYIKITD